MLTQRAGDQIESALKRRRDEVAEDAGLKVISTECGMLPMDMREGEPAAKHPEQTRLNTSTSLVGCTGIVQVNRARGGSEQKAREE